MKHSFIMFLSFVLFLSLINFSFSKKGKSDDNDNNDEEVDGQIKEISSTEITKKLKATRIKGLDYKKLNYAMEIKRVFLDNGGTFKYVQIAFNGRIYIRGTALCKYHICIVKRFKNYISQFGLGEYPIKVLGGGRIKMQKKSKKILIYGYSNRYGRYKEMHKITKEIMEKEATYKGYTIEYKNSGY